MERFTKRLLGCLVMLGGLAHAQQLQVVSGKTLIEDVPMVGRTGQWGKPKPLAAAACGPDTLAYGLNKSTGLRILNVNGSNSAACLGQYYDAPQAITISQVRFYAYKLSIAGGVTSNVVVEIYNARPDSLPLGAPIQFTTVQVDTNYYGGSLAALQKVATFNTPVTVTGPYIVAVRNNSANPVGVVINDYTAMDGANEWLASAQINGTWRHGYQVNVGMTPFNCDVLLDPVCTYSLKSNFTASPSCIITAGFSTFTNTSSPVMRHRMYSLAEFLHLGGLQVRWTFGDGSASVRQITNYDTTHFYNVFGNYPVTLTDSIIGWSMQCVADTTILMGQPPVAAFSQTANNLLASFTNQSTNGPTTYLWDFGDGQTSTAMSPQHAYAVGGTYQVCMTATSACGTDSVCHPVTVTCPVPATAYATSTINLTVQFTDQTTGTGVNSWMWTFGDGGTSLTQSPSHTYALPGTYLACLTTTNACGMDSVCHSITVACPTPSADYAQNGAGLTINFNDLSTGSVTGRLWDFGDGGSATTANPTHTYASAGNYQVCLTATNACGDDSICRHIDVPLVAIDPALAGLKWELSPNPAQNQVQLVLTLPEAAEVSIGLYNVLGERLRDYDLGPIRSETLLLEVGDLPSGSYWLAMRTPGGQVAKRLMVLH